MHISLIAVGARQPQWVDAAFREYAARLPRAWQFRLCAVPAARRSSAGPVAAAIAAEERNILQRVDADALLVLLDERGRQLSSSELAAQLGAWQAGGRDLRFVIGGPDGVSDGLRAKAGFCWSLSRLTLPHGLTRILFAEQLYRAWSIREGHPYHRERAGRE